MVDYRKTIEAVRNDGLVLEVYFTGSRADGDFEVEAADPEKAPAGWSDGYHRADGQSVDPGDKWIVRNVATDDIAAPKYPEALVERAMKFIRITAKCEPIKGNGLDEQLVATARAIAAELPAEVDADVAAAEAYAKALGWSEGDTNFDSAVALAVQFRRHDRRRPRRSGGGAVRRIAGQTGDWVTCPRCKGSGDQRTLSDRFWSARGRYCNRCDGQGVVQLGITR